MTFSVYLCSARKTEMKTLPVSELPVNNHAPYYKVPLWFDYTIDEDDGFYRIVIDGEWVKVNYTLLETYCVDNYTVSGKDNKGLYCMNKDRKVYVELHDVLGGYQGNEWYRFSVFQKSKAT